MGDSTRKDLLKTLREKQEALIEAAKNRMLRKKGGDLHEVKKVRKDIARIKTQLRTLTN